MHSGSPEDESDELDPTANLTETRAALHCNPNLCFYCLFSQFLKAEYIWVTVSPDLFPTFP